MEAQLNIKNTTKITPKFSNIQNQTVKTKELVTQIVKPDYNTQDKDDKEFTVPYTFHASRKLSNALTTLYEDSKE